MYFTVLYVYFIQLVVIRKESNKSVLKETVVGQNDKMTETLIWRINLLLWKDCSHQRLFFKIEKKLTSPGFFKCVKKNSRVQFISQETPPKRLAFPRNLLNIYPLRNRAYVLMARHNSSSTVFIQHSCHCFKLKWWSTTVWVIVVDPYPSMQMFRTLYISLVCLNL